MRSPRSNKRRHIEWAILVYQAGDNNLSEECMYALTEMQKVGTSNDFDVFVQFDPSGRGSEAFRCQIGVGEGAPLKDFTPLGEIDSSDPDTLIDFLRYCLETDRPAKHYMLVLSGHGAGFAEGFFLKDEERPLSLIPTSFPIGKLKAVFTDEHVTGALNGPKIDILGFDCCMMSMVEVCYQLRDISVLNLVIGSEGFTLNSGWPLGEIMEELKKKASYDPSALAHIVVNKYAAFYKDYHLGGLSVDLSIVRLQGIVELTKVVDELAEAMIMAFEEESTKERSYEPKGKPFQDAILLSHWAAQSYNGEQCVDLYDFCDLLQQRLTANHPVSKSCEKIKHLFERRKDPLVLKTCISGSAFQFSRGISIYFPWGEYDLDPSYQTLDFAKTDNGQSPWLKFLRHYLKETKRRPLGTMFRSTPPTSKGPQGKIHSMRNPPNEFPRDYCVGPKRSGVRKAKSR